MFDVPMADNEPDIVWILRILVCAPNAMSIIRDSANEKANEIIKAWDAREDLGELKKPLGFNMARGRRRTAITVRRRLPHRARTWDTYSQLMWERKLPADTNLRAEFSSLLNYWRGLG
jgi:hypothetical protein